MMPITKIPGIKVRHAIITPVCRKNRTLEGAFEEAVRRLKDEYYACLQYSGNDEADFHLVLTLDRPKEDESHG